MCIHMYYDLAAQQINHETQTNHLQTGCVSVAVQNIHSILDIAERHSAKNRSDRCIVDTSMKLGTYTLETILFNF